MIYFFSQGTLRTIFVYFSKNLAVSDNKYLDEIRRLKSDNLRIFLELEQFKDLRNENERLKEILEFKKKKKVELVSLQVIGIEPSRFRRVILADAGVDRDLRENMLVLDEKSFLVGKVLRVYNDYSEVTLVNDSQFSITVKIGNNLGLLKGTLGGVLKIFYIERDSTIKKGDKVFAISYYTGSYFLVGKVKRIRHDQNSLFLDITVEPSFGSYFPKTIFAVK